MAAGAESTGRTVARNASLLAAATVLSRVAIFGLSVAIARGLGAEPYGRYGVALALATVLVAVADIGATPYIAREAARAREQADAVVATLFRVKLAGSVATVLVVTVSAWLVVDDAGLVAAIAVVLVAGLVEGLSRFVYGYFQGRERMAFEAMTTIGAAFARAAGGVLIVILVGELLPVLLWLMVVSLGQLAVTGIRLRRTVAVPIDGPRRPPGARVDWRAALAMGVMAIFVMVYLRVDTVLVAWLLDEQAAGWYTAAYTLMASLQIAPWMLAIALAPVFARSFARDRRLFDVAWQDGLKAVLLISLPLAAVMSLLSRPIIGRLFGDGFGPSSDALAILAWAVPLAGLNVVAVAVLRAAGRERPLVTVSAAGAVMNVALNLWAIRAFGIDGAAAVTIATETAVFFGLAGIAWAHGVVGRPRLPYGRIGLALLALAAVAVLGRALPVEVAVAGSFLAYAAVIWVSGVLRMSDLSMLSSVLRRPRDP